MCKLFDKNSVYNTNAIAQIYFDAYPEQYKSLGSCQTAVSNRATKLENEGIIQSINQQKRNRVYSGLNAETICDSLKVSSKAELPLFSGLSKSFLEDVNDDIEFSGWVGLGQTTRSRIKEDILISTQLSNGKERITVRFNIESYKKIFSDEKKVSLYVSKNNSIFFIIPGEVDGVSSWTVTEAKTYYKFSVRLQESLQILLHRFLGSYNTDELVQTGLKTPDGSTVKAWGFKLKAS